MKYQVLLLAVLAASLLSCVSATRRTKLPLVPGVLIDFQNVTQTPDGQRHCRIADVMFNAKSGRYTVICGSEPVKKGKCDGCRADSIFFESEPWERGGDDADECA